MKHKKVLVLAVGGGNDSVSTILLQIQLNRSFNYNPDHIDIVAVLPDCLGYHSVQHTGHPLISTIHEQSKRSVNGNEINAFPERILAQNKSLFKELKIKNIYGISMKDGSYGVLSGLKYLINTEKYDLILSIDVGGDFIADKYNFEVLSPMMDGYMLFALKELKKHIKINKINTDMLFAIFGLGTDGESSPEMLKKALELIPDIQEHYFNQSDVSQFIDFYRNVVEKNRYSRTTDYTINEICGISHENPSLFRGRFHIQTEKNNKPLTYYGNFNHEQNPEYFGKYYLFKDIDNINNFYSRGVKSGIDWFVNVQLESSKINHELNGQSYKDLSIVLKNKSFENLSLFFCTPSRKFNEDTQKLIVNHVSDSIINSVYDFAFIYKSYTPLLKSGVSYINFNDDLAIISLNQSNTIELKTAIMQHTKD